MMRHLDAHDQLIETYRNVLEIDDQNTTAYRELERLFQITEEWGALASLLQERIDRHEGEETLPSTSTSETASEESAEGVDSAEQDDSEPQANLQASKATTRSSNQESRAELRRRLAKLLEQLNEYDEAIETWRALLDEDDDTFEPAFESLEQMASDWRGLGVDEPRRQIVSEILTPLYKAQGQWEAWVRSTEDGLDFMFDPEERSELLQGIAQCVEDDLGDEKRALEYYALAFQGQADNETVEGHIDRLIEVTESWERGVQIIENVVSEVFDPEESTRLWLKIAQLYEGQLSDDERAHHALVQARSLTPESMEAITELRRFYNERERYRELVDLLKEVAPLMEEEADRVSALTKAGELLTKSLGALEEGVEVYQLLRQEAPEDLQPLVELEGLYRLNNDWCMITAEGLTKQRSRDGLNAHPFGF